MFAYNVKAGVVLYWIAGNLWTMGQTQFLYRKSAPKPVIKGIDGTELAIKAPSTPSATPAPAAGGGFRAALKAAREAAASGTTPTGRPANGSGGSGGSAPGKGTSNGAADAGSGSGASGNGASGNGASGNGAGGGRAPKVTPTAKGKNTTKQTVRKPSASTTDRPAPGSQPRSGKKKKG